MKGKENTENYHINMQTDEHSEFLQIKKCALKVNIHCDGCMKKVKRILKKIEGVFRVDIDAEKQKVKVYGNVDSTTLINKLVKSGKHAEIWPTNDKKAPNFINAGNDQNQIQNLIRSLNLPKSQPLLTPNYPIRFEDQMPFERFLQQGMDVENHGNMGWDDQSLGEYGSGFIDLEGSQLGRRCNGGLQSYYDHQASMPIMNMYYQQSHPLTMMMNMNAPNNNMNMNMNLDGMGHVMMHDTMYMHRPEMANYVFPMFHHAHRACYY